MSTNVEGTPDPLNLGVPNAAGSLVGLTPRETPATVNIVTQRDMQEKGLRTMVETLNSVPGVMSGNLPGEPGVISMRGFSRAATGYAIDGVRAPDPLIVSRDFDTFNFERVEILKGPASVIQCQSAPKFDPVSASKFDPFDRRGLAVALGPSELAGIAETDRARVV